MSWIRSKAMGADIKFQKLKDLNVTFQSVTPAKDMEREREEIARLEDQINNIELNPAEECPDRPAIEQEKTTIIKAEFEEFEQIEEEDPISDDFFQ